MAWNARPEEAYSVGAIRQSDVRKRIRKGSIMLMLALLTAFITRSRIPLTSLQQGKWTEALLWASIGAFGYIVSVYFALAGLRSFIPPIQKPKSDWDKKLSDKQRTLWGFPRPQGHSKGQAPLSAVSQPAAKSPAPLGPPARNAKPITAATPTGETGVLDQSPFTPQSTGSDKARASSPYSSVPAVTTPEQLQHYLDAFEERMGMSGGAGPQGTEGHQTADLGLGRNPVAAQLLMASQGGPTYRPSLQARGTAGSPLRGGDGRLAPSSQETVESVLARLRVDRRTLEVWTDRLREWLAAHVIQPLLRCVDSAHTAVSEAAGQLGWSGLALSPLGEPEASGGSRRLDADDEALLMQLREALNRYLGDPAQAAQRQKVISCLEAVLQYQRLAALLRGDHPRGLLPPVPRGYIAFRLRDLAVGSCVGQFTWNSGGAWLGKPWSPELLTDSALVFYLFAAFLEAPRWFFPLEEVQQGVSTAVPLYIGSLPSRPAEQCTALLPVRPATLPSGATAILALGLALVPNFTLVLKGEPVLTLSNNTAVLQVILLMLQATKLSGRADIGGHSLDHLRLTSVLRPADRVHSLFVGKWFGVW